MYLNQPVSELQYFPVTFGPTKHHEDFDRGVLLGHVREDFRKDFHLLEQSRLSCMASLSHEVALLNSTYDMFRSGE